MSDILAAKRYARALFEAAREQGAERISEVEIELKAVVDALKANHDLLNLLQNPSLDITAKKQLLERIFASSVSELVMNTLYLLIDRRRAEVLESMASSYVKIADEALGQTAAVVYSPLALSEGELASIAATFGQITGYKIRVESVIDKSLIGGIRVRIGDRLYDGSLAGKLDRLHKMMNQAQAL